MPSEGGHVEFGPRDQFEIELLSYLMKSYGHVSYERLLSGPGLFNIYRFLRDTGRGEEPRWLAERIKENDPSSVITDAALDGSCELCDKAIDIFVSVYGAEAGNLAMKFFATGGLFIGGGIAPKIIKKLKGPLFKKSFTDKGRMRSLMESIPVSVILNDKTALFGAALFASRMSEQ